MTVFEKEFYFLVKRDDISDEDKSVMAYSYEKAVKVINREWTEKVGGYGTTVTPLFALVSNGYFNIFKVGEESRNAFVKKVAEQWSLKTRWKNANNHIQSLLFKTMISAADVIYPEEKLKVEPMFTRRFADILAKAYQKGDPTYSNLRLRAVILYETLVQANQHNTVFTDKLQQPELGYIAVNLIKGDTAGGKAMVLAKVKSIQ